MIRIFLQLSLLAAVVCLSGCQRSSNGSMSEAWSKQWEIVMGGKWISGELAPGTADNRPNWEGSGKRKGLLELHPISAVEPARIRFTGIIPMDAPELVVEASGNYQGDCILQCSVDERIVGSYTLDGSKWTACIFDLSEYIGKQINLEIQNAVGGADAWHFEHCYIDTIRFEQKNRTR